MKTALTVAGSDSGGGAGIQADLKTFAAFGVYGASVLTALTAQNTDGVQGVFEIPPAFVSQQLDSVFGDIGVDVVKTGMLANAEIIEVIADRLEAYEVTNLVIDPVMVAKSGDPLLHPSARYALIEALFPLALIATPNRYEAEVLTGLTLTTRDDMEVAARAIQALGPRMVVVKGGHIDTGDEVVDVFFDGDQVHSIPGPRIDTANNHGTGCTFASAIAAGLARGFAPIEAITLAKRYLTAALEAAVGQRLGQGHGPVAHHAPQALAISGLCGGGVGD